jgi:23S rRNA (guanosine2251-2'-O)-methyltransferase
LTQLAGSERHQGVVAIVDATVQALTLDGVLESLAEPALLLVLDGVTDPHNLGTCLRNADAFGAQAVIIPKDRATGVNATVAKAASGAADTVPVITVTNLARTMRTLKENGVWLLGADVGVKPVGADLADRRVGAGCGGRACGLTRETCDRIVGIPLVGTVGA